MVRITSAAFALLLAVPTFAAPISFEDLEARDPNFFSSVAKGVKHLATPKNLKTAARFASLLIRREDGLGNDLVELSERDLDQLVTGLEDIAAREPNFHSLLNKVKKVATPHNIRTVANIAKAFFRRDLEDDAAAGLVARDLSEEANLEELLAREPNWHSLLNKVKKVATPHNIHTVAGIVKAFVRRELEEGSPDDLVARDLPTDEALEDLLAREPNLRSLLHKVKKVATPHNIHTVANIVKTFIRRELEEDAKLSARDLSIEDSLDALD